MSDNWKMKDKIQPIQVSLLKIFSVYMFNICIPVCVHQIYIMYSTV